METSTAEAEGSNEDVTGKKKSRLKVLRARLFGRMKRKETEGLMKQSQSVSDVTAGESEEAGGDSGDEFLCSQSTLENVPGKVKALQMKLQQQNMRLSSEDDGLPHSPPETSLSLSEGIPKFPVTHRNLSSLSLVGTGSEEEEQPDPTATPAAPPGVDFDSPAQFKPCLDNSAARHRMSIKPRNQRASAKGRRLPSDVSRPQELIAYQREFHALRERLRVAEHRTLQRSSELNTILEQFRRAIAETNGSKDALTNFSHETQKLLKELAHRKPLQVGLGRTGVTMVMGIPTVKRKVKSYLAETLHSLIDKLSPEERLDCVIIVFVGETDSDYVHSVVEDLEKEFSTEFNSGLLEVISPPASYYPRPEEPERDFRGLQGEGQVADEAELGLLFPDDVCCQQRGGYYVQLEDDIVAKPNYFATMKNFALQLSSEDLDDSGVLPSWASSMFQAPDLNLIVEFIFMFYKEKPIGLAIGHILWVKVCNPEKDALEDDIVAKPNYFATMKNFALQLSSEDWMILEFSQLGFIGKMFQAPDLNLIVEFIFMFYKEKPIDWLLDHILWVKVCNPEKDAKHCERQKSGLRVRFRPSLFQHVGLHSSLAGKIQKLTDKDFLKPLLHKIHVNPPAEVSTTLKVYQGHTLEKTYLGEDFFWAITPNAGDYILFKFDRPVSIQRYLFRSGNQEHPGDRLENATVEVLPLSDAGMQTKDKYKRTEDRYYRIGQFEKGVAEAAVDPTFNPVVALRLTLLKDSAVWAIISEIHIKKVAG
ncbi:hypothetical protein SKAU_G00254460 [Synaphobranchus kaupii]|uniref:Alpha-1,3-mannosyl-glycoprotein 4-beta-N-acetylglucosaminyltransferase A n=1 Tax=Synaphobranchus kaupii TaxID=118154 RepID=A0A9Q1IR97_SYNKA|nr:hypothetical protein SKAU_G00254460 [Synaphobranchus kaupii]